ncbi:MAG: hypothetical protein M1479_10430 [Actinobacteria bacterium]|nr:hypothetical protein [Actinomycetota bacterium]
MKNNKKKKLVKFLNSAENTTFIINNDKANIIQKPDYRLFLGIFFISTALLSFEITITRISSIIFSYNYVFLIVSLAILGLGCGGIFAYHKLRDKAISFLNSNLYNIISFYSSLFALSVTFFIILTTLIPFFTSGFLFFIISFLPFFFVGFLMAAIFRTFPHESFKMYAFDLLGASSGAVLVIYGLNKFGGVNLTLLIGILGVISVFLLMNWNKRNISFKRIISISVITFFITSIFITNMLFGFLGEIPVRNEILKDLSNVLAHSNSEIVESRWSAFGRVDLIKSLDNPDSMGLFIDGAAGTEMYKFSGNTEKTYTNMDYLSRNLLMAFPFLFIDDNQKDNMLVIGPGGGREILLGLINKVKFIKGVEVNKDFIDIVKDYKDYNGGIYTNFENVDIVAGEGRNFIRNSNEKFDIIMMTLPNTKSSRSIEGYALTENYLFTVESIQDYFNHLTQEGEIIVVLHDRVEVMRFITTSLRALENLGINNKEAMDHIYTVGKEMMPLVVLRKDPFFISESNKLHEYMHLLELDSEQNYIPHIKQEILKYKHSDGTIMEHLMFNDSLVNLSRGDISLKELIKPYYYDIKPVVDDRPFFFDKKSGISNNLLILFVIAIIVNFSVIVPPLKIGRKRKSFFKLVLLFLLLGAGFMMIELSFFQKLTFYMSSPTISLAVILSSLLAGMGIGSILSKRIFLGKNIKRLIIFTMLIFIAVTGFFFIIPIIMNNLAGSGILVKAVIASLILAPIGFILGVPFPTGIDLAKEMGFEGSITWLYGINGTMSVLGSVIAMIIATTFGFTMALILGTLSYLIISIIFMLRKKELQSDIT